MISAEKKIVNDILDRIERNGDNFHRWYVGATKDLKQVMHKQQKVYKKKCPCIIRKAVSSSSAKYVESHFLQLGCEGSKSEKNYEAIYVYAYRKPVLID